MKHSLFVFILITGTLSCFSQTRSDYDAAVSKFQNFYNNGQTDSIYEMLSERSKNIMPHDNTVQTFKQLKPKLGDLRSYEYSKQKENIRLYKTVFANTTLTLAISLNSDNKLETFRFVPYQPDTVVTDKSDVVLQTASGAIHGTLSVPDGAAKIPVVLIIAGSGSTDRDGNNPLGVKANSYKMVADSLLSAGIACLRYDKRGGVGAVTFDDYISDAIGLIKMLKEDKRFSKIFVLGHSEGSLVGMIAAEKEKVSGFISVSGAGERIDKIIVKQVSDQSKELGGKAAIILDSLVKGYTVKDTDPSLDMVLGRSVQPYLRSWLKYDPQEEIKKLTEPILIIQGTTDIQVRVDEAERLKKANPHATLKIVKGMNHILKQAPEDRQQNIATYANPDLPLSAGFMPEIIKFVSGSKTQNKK